MTVCVKDTSTPDVMTKLGCGVKIKSIQEDELCNLCIGFLVIWCNPTHEVSLSGFVPSKLVLSLQNQLSFCVLKECFKETLSIF